MRPPRPPADPRPVYIIGLAPLTVDGRPRRAVAIDDIDVLRSTRRAAVVADPEAAGRVLSIAASTGDYATAVERLYGDGLTLDAANVHARIGAADRLSGWAVVVYTETGRNSLLSTSCLVQPPYVVFGRDHHVVGRNPMGPPPGSVPLASRPAGNAETPGFVVIDDFDQLPQLFRASTTAAVLAI